MRIAMIHNRMVFLILLLFYLAGWASETRQIPPASLVEGSIHGGGLQPDYIFDVESAAFEMLNKKALLIGKSEMSVPERVRLVIALVREIFAVHNDAKDPIYLEILRDHREKGTPVRLSRYVECGAGVCRENALILHHLLKLAGVPNSHVYIKYAIIYEGAPPFSEDHGFAVFKFQGERWIADSYYKQFNGYSFDELLANREHLRPLTRRLQFAEVRTEPKALLQIYSFPRVHPLNVNQCQLLFY